MDVGSIEMMIVERVDLVFVGALIWLFNRTLIKGRKSLIPDEFIPLISVALGFIAALIIHVADGAGFSRADIGQLLITGVLYGIAAVVIQGLIKKGVYDLSLKLTGKTK